MDAQEMEVPIAWSKVFQVSYRVEDEKFLVEAKPDDP